MMHALTTAPPSRHSNPFATCWTRPGAIEYQFAADQGAESVLGRFATSNWWGAIVGVHGSGKSTLVETLRPHFVAAGRSVAIIALRDGQRRLPRRFVRVALAAARPLLVVDGYEQLGRLSRAALRWRCRQASAGLLVTAHGPVGLPTLYRTHSSLALAERIVSTLTERTASPISRTDVAASHARCGSNLRELLFALYERHEALVRTDERHDA